MILTRFICLDKTCSHYSEIKNSTRKQFYDHVLEKPRTRLKEICDDFDILPFPQNESKYTLVNSIVDYSHELVVDCFPNRG